MERSDQTTNDWRMMNGTWQMARGTQWNRGGGGIGGQKVTPVAEEQMGYGAKK